MTQTLTAFPIAVFAFALLLIHVLALGLFVVRALGFRSRNLCSRNVWMKCVAVIACGLGAFGHAILLLGHVHLLHRATFIVTGIGALFYLWMIWPRDALRLLQRKIQAQITQDRVLVWSSLVMLLVIFVSGLRPWQLSGAGDEQGYHWSAPLFWASQGGWETSPFKLTNSFALVQVTYTHSAVFDSFIAAHWTHSLFLMVLLGACASLATSLGARPIPAIAVALSVPVAVIQSSVSYNDVATAAFVTSAYAILLGSAKDDTPSRVLAGFLFACAIATKPMSAVALPIALIFVVVEARKRRKLAREIAFFISPIVLVVVLWLVHAYAMTGHFWSNEGVIMVNPATDPRWLTGAATGRYATWRDLLLLPTIPFVAPIWGNPEPLGGRTGLLLPFALWGIYEIRHLSLSKRALAKWLLAAGASYFLLLGTIAIKTRFHIFVWMTLAVFAAVSFSRLTTRETVAESAPAKATDWRKQSAFIAFYVLLWFSTFGDSARVLLRNIARLP